MVLKHWQASESLGGGLVRIYLAGFLSKAYHQVGLERGQTSCISNKQC